MSLTFFKRTEKKYMLDESTYRRFRSLVGDRLTEDNFSRSLVCSTYLDTPDFLLIRNSIDAVDYKEKLRLRTYGTTANTAFLELKKKYRGTVFKRRVELPYSLALSYVFGKSAPPDSQIMREIDYAMKLYRNPLPVCLLTYEREAYRLRDSGVRITFDRRVRYRMSEPLITMGTHGKQILDDGAAYALYTN